MESMERITIDNLSNICGYGVHIKVKRADNGKVVIDGDTKYIKRIDEEGYEFIKTELGIDIQKEESSMNTVSIGSCAVKDAIK